jgi:hypothetical protein
MSTSYSRKAEHRKRPYYPLNNKIQFDILFQVRFNEGNLKEYPID